MIDINADIGEGYSNDAALMPYITSCNIACGGHAGNATILTESLRLAKKHCVKIGTHPSYPDKENFGRKSIAYAKDAFQASIREQLSLFENAVQTEDVPWHHIKPHGALYNDMATNAALAHQFLEVALEFPQVQHIYCMAGQPIVSTIAEVGLIPVEEGFADRAYEDNGTLVSRNKKGAILKEVEVVKSQINAFKKGSVKTLSGKIISLNIATVCIHGDGSNALLFAKTISRILG